MLKLSPFQFPNGKLKLSITFGLSNKMSDIDNPVKPFVDILQKKYGFNDKMIKRCTIDVQKTKKGSEYIKFKLKELQKCNPQNGT